MATTDKKNLVKIFSLIKNELDDVVRVKKSNEKLYNDLEISNIINSEN